jgi:SAM-dependent methyltransferase
MSFRLDDDAHGELDAYLQEDFKRFLYTLDLIPKKGGKLLEIGSNPYFNSILIEKFREYDTFYTNFFGADYNGSTVQNMRSKDYDEEYEFKFVNHNIEASDIPFDEKFDTVVFCEVLEHLTTDPLKVLLRIKDCLKQDGTLILTTPNVNRLENVAKMLAGSNIYDPYSGYGPYGRHNREYNKHELLMLLEHAGFEVEILFSSDVHDNRSNDYFDVNSFGHLVDFRSQDLGQYLFVKANNSKKANRCKPKWLYRSYPIDELCK